MSEPTRIRVEDVLAFGFSVALALFSGVRALRSGLEITEEHLWDISYILAPVALLLFGASVQFAVRGRAGGRSPLEIVRIGRDWLPFLIFSLAYTAFRGTIFMAILGPDRDRELLAIDRALLGETPAVFFSRMQTTVSTDVLAIFYFLHLVLPPILALALYVKEREVFRAYLLSILLTGFLGSIGYVTVPAIGPGLAYPDLFASKLSGDAYRPVAELLDQARAPRDVFPSLHVAVSSVVLWFAWRRGPGWFWGTLPFVLGNWISTLYLRYHYFVDVFAGWATAALCVWLATKLLDVEERLAGWWRAAGPAGPSVGSDTSAGAARDGSRAARDS